MTDIMSTELKSDLEHIYKIAGDLLNAIDTKKEDPQKMLEQVKSSLMDITGTLQKDIYNCDTLITKLRTI